MIDNGIIAIEHENVHGHRSIIFLVLSAVVFPNDENLTTEYIFGSNSVMTPLEDSPNTSPNVSLEDSR